MMGKTTWTARVVSVVATGALALSLVPGIAFADTMTKAQAIACIEAAQINAEAGNALSDEEKANVARAVDVLADADYESAAQQVFALKVKVEVAQADKTEAERKATDAEGKLADAEQKVSEAGQKASEAEKKAADAEKQASDSAKKAKDAEGKLADAEKEIKSLTKELAAAQTSTADADKVLLKHAKVSSFTAKGDMKKAKLSWKLSESIPSVKYQVKYRVKGTSTWSKKTVKKASATVTGLKKNKTYQFKVRPYKKISGKNVYGSYSSVATAKVLASYKTGAYTVNDAAGINVRAKKSTTSSVIRALKNGTKVTVEKCAVGSDKEVWGQISVKVGTDTKTGYVQMKYLKAA